MGIRVVRGSIVIEDISGFSIFGPVVKASTTDGSRVDIKLYDCMRFVCAAVAEHKRSNDLAEDWDPTYDELIALIKAIGE